MRSILLATIARRQGISFQIKTAGYEVIGTMTLNPATARHEMEITEERFLKHAKELARICAIPGMAWYVVEFREEEDAPMKGGFYEWPGGKPVPDEARKLDEGKEHIPIKELDANLAKDDLDGMRYFSLRKIASDEEIDLTGATGVAEIRQRIREARMKKAA